MLINIPKPCNEDWHSMTPTQKGAFCGSCAKEVVDFSKMVDEEVLHYLNNNAGKRICGRVSQAQLKHIAIHIPEAVFIKKISSWKKFLAVLIVCFSIFMTGCSIGGEEHMVKGEIIQTESPEKTKFEGEIKRIDDRSNLTISETPQQIKVTKEYVPPALVTRDFERPTMGTPQILISDTPPPPPAIDDMVDGMIVMPVNIVDTTNQKPLPKLKKDSLPICDKSIITKV